MSITEPIREKGKVEKIIDFYLLRNDIRNHTLMVMSVYTALRISDLLRLTWGDVYDFENKRFRRSITVVEKKTGKSKIIALNRRVTAALNLGGPGTNPDRFLFENKRTKKAIGRVQAYRIIRAAAESLNFSERVSCHSLRKTFGYHAWKKGAPPVVIMDIYNHSSWVVTRRYLGVTQDDKNDVYMGLDFTG